MSAITFSMKDLIEAGVHFGHKTKRWNPKMAPFIYGVRNDTHIIDLNKTVPLMYNALQAAYNVAKSGGRVLFVGTKRQAASPIADAARSCGQFYVNHRWLGGMLTNWKTIQNSIRRMYEVEDAMASGQDEFTKKELLNMQRDYTKLDLSLGGIRKMGHVPDLVIVIDVVFEDLAVKEANKLGIPVIGIVDTNADIAGINHPIPGNDDATKAILLYCNLFAQAIRQGMRDGGIALPEEQERGDMKRTEDAMRAGEREPRRERGTKMREVTVGSFEDLAAEAKRNAV